MKAAWIDAGSWNAPFLSPLRSRRDCLRQVMLAHARMRSHSTAFPKTTFRLRRQSTAGHNAMGGRAYPGRGSLPLSCKDAGRADRVRTPSPASPAYSVTARLLHWITAAFILLMVPLGVIIASEWGGSWQTFLYDLHRSIGATLIPIIILRLAYRFAHPPLSLPDHIPAIERSVAE